MIIKDTQISISHRRDNNHTEHFARLDKIFNGRIILAIPFVADLISANIYRKTTKSLQSVHREKLNENIKAGHRSLEHIENYLLEKKITNITLRLLQLQ